MSRINGRALTRQSRRIHRWSGWVAGLVMAVWVVSGVIMILPGGSTAVAPPGLTPPQMGQVTLSPAAALAAAAAPPASEVVLKTLGSDPVYQVFLGPGRSVLVHGSTGAIVTLTPARAESLAFGAGAARGRVPELIEAHSRRYPSGPLPVWRFAADTPGEFLDVSTRDGAIERTSGVVRLRRSISEWHTFGPLRRVVGGRITHLSLLGTSLLAFVMVATGYVLIFPRRRSQD